MPGRDSPRVARRYPGPNTQGELAAYGAGARAGAAGEHGALLYAHDGFVPWWAFAPDERKAAMRMPREEAIRWFRRGYTEETSRLGEHDRQPGEED